MTHVWSAMTGKRKWFGGIFSMVAILLGATPAQASRLDVGELGGGGVIWDGDSEVRTMNIFSAKTETLGADVVVTRTLFNDFDGMASFSVVRLFLSVNNADVDQFAPGELITVDAARIPGITSFVDANGADIDAAVVAFTANLSFNSLDSTYRLNTQSQQQLLALLQAHPGVTFIAGLGVGNDGNTLSNCNPADPEDCLGGEPLRARARFDLATVPEPTTLLLLGTGVIASRLRRRRKSS